MDAALAIPLAAAVLACAAVVAWVVRPLIDPVAEPEPPDPVAVALLARRERSLAMLRDLDADHAAGRIGETDYRRWREDAAADGVTALAALDAYSAERSARRARLTARVEADVAARRGDVFTAPSACCPGCGRVERPGDAFCPGCGRRQR